MCGTRLMCAHTDECMSVSLLYGLSVLYTNLYVVYKLHTIVFRYGYVFK